jgi:glycerol kinase
VKGERVLAIDQGTSGTKAIVVDPGDGVVAEVEVELAPDYLPGGGVELDPGALLESVLGAGREALAQSGGPAGAVALANQGETVLAWDQDSGQPLSRAIVWQDRRAADVCAELSDYRDMFAARRRDHNGLLAYPSAVRRVRHRCLNGEQVACAGHRPGRVGPGATRPVRPRR